MGEIRSQRPVLLIAAISSRYVDAIDDWSRETIEKKWGPIVLESEMFNFDQTSFYTRSMGQDLKKRLFALETLIDPARLTEIKIQANNWEADFTSAFDFPEERPLNIDPGYLTEAKLVLATTKDRDHRLYLKDGIFAEVTLFFKGGSWQSSRWTYPDYLTKQVQDFLDSCRSYLRKRYANLI